MSKIRELTEEEIEAFRLVQEGNTKEVLESIDNGKVRVNCLDKSGMNLLDQASFKGNVELVQGLLSRGADADNRAHEHSYTCLMFAAMTGKTELCEILLNAGARPHATNNINKTAAELAAFVAQHECVSLINSYITREDIDKIIHPKGKESEVIYPESVVNYIHELTRTHLIHPITIALNLQDQPDCIKHLKKIIYVVDRLFERQLRSKETNEVLSIKLWFVLTSLKKIEAFLKLKQEEGKDPKLIIKDYIKALSAWKINDNIINRTNLEKYLLSAAFGFPYQHSMMYKALGQGMKEVKPGKYPSVFTVICGSVFGQRFAVCAGFCSFCGKPKPENQCGTCKVLYCSETCQKLDWWSHKSVCHVLKATPELNAYRMPSDDGVTYITHENLSDFIDEDDKTETNNGDKTDDSKDIQEKAENLSLS